MSGFQRLAIGGVAVAVAVAGGVAAVSVVDWSASPIEQADPPFEMANSLQDPVVLVEPPADVREAERSRRARRPADSMRKFPGRAYDAVLEGRGGDGRVPRPKPAQPRPPAAGRSGEAAPRH